MAYCSRESTPFLSLQRARKGGNSCAVYSRGHRRGGAMSLLWVWLCVCPCIGRSSFGPVSHLFFVSCTAHLKHTF